MRKIPIGEATELVVETPDTSNLDKGLYNEKPGKVPNGPTANRTTFQGPPRPAAMAPLAEASQGMRAPGTIGRILQTGAANAPALSRAAGAAGTAVAALPEAVNVGRVAADPNSSKIDVATQAAEGAGRLGTAGLGAMTGATLGAPLAPFTAGLSVPIGAALGGAAGYFAGDRAIKGLRSAVGVDPTSPVDRVQAPAALPAASYSNEGRNYPTRTGAPDPGPLMGPATPAQPISAQPENNIVRDGNSYSGKDIKFGANIINPDATLRKGGTVTSLDMSAGAEMDRRMLATLRAERAEREAGFAVNQPGGGLSGFGGNTLGGNALRAKMDEGGGMPAGLSARQQAAWKNAQADRAQRATEAAAANARADQGLRIAEMSDATTRRGQDMAAGTARNQTAAQMAASADRAKREQANSDRQYELDVARFGSDQAEKNRSAREGAEKAYQSRLENSFRTTDKDGKDVADTGKVAAFNRAMDASLPEIIKELRATGTPAALAKAKDLETRKTAAMSPDDLGQFIQMFETREQLRAARSGLPGGAEFKDSDNLLNFRQRGGDAGIDRRMLTPNRVVFQGGSSATPNDLSIRGGANAFLPDWGAVRTDDLLRGIRQP